MDGHAPIPYLCYESTLQYETPFHADERTKEIKKGMKGYEKEMMMILKRNESTLTPISIKLLDAML